MGVMADGVWITDEGIAARPDGTYQRTPSQLLGKIEAGTAHPPEAGRYHLYAAWNCPWAHRALLTRVVLGLENAVGVSFCAPRRTDQGWVFDDTYRDDLFGSAAVHEIYARSDAAYSGRVTVPVLWDKVAGRIVSNESADIVCMLGQAMAALGNGADIYPQDLRADIDDWSARIHSNLNNGVYRAGFAESQEAYEAGARSVFETLDAIEAHLGADGWFFGDRLTETDIRMFPTLARFDVAYHYAFRCNLAKISDYPKLWAYARRFYAHPGVAQTVDFDIYKRGYNSPSEKRNPLGIVPIGPKVDWSL